MVICKKCGASLMPGVTFCPSCGTDVNSGACIVVCDNCNTENDIGTRFCKSCGRVLIKKEKKVACQVCGMDNPVDAVFCVVCGAEIKGERNVNLEPESITKLRSLLPTIQRITTSFYEEFAGATPAEVAALSYVCPMCGKLNNNNQEKCVRCGRDKVRTADLIAKGRVANFDEVVPVPDKKFKVPLVKPSEAKKEAVQQKNNNQRGGYNSGPMAPIVQPIAFVPYVSQDPNLWQSLSKEEE